MPIPRQFHFITGLDDRQGGRPFSFIHYLAVQSALTLNPDFACTIYLRHEPWGSYWDLVRERVRVVPVVPPESVHGIPIHHYAHKTDLLRLRILGEHGGIYLDMDTICQRPFAPLLHHRVVMGLEAYGTEGAVMGLCNATILAEPGAPFIRAWEDSFRDFDNADWNKHAVRRPFELARTMGEGQIHIEPPVSFFWPDWTDTGLDLLFLRDGCYPDAYSFHLWETKAWHFIRHLDARRVHDVDTAYNRVARRFVARPVAEVARPTRLNLGCGRMHLDGWLNADAEVLAYADATFDPAAPGWPIATGSITQVRAWHVLERIGDGLRTAMQELYRVCADGAVVDIRVCHPAHDNFTIDPGHVRAFHPQTFSFFDRRTCVARMRTDDMKTPSAVHWGIDFATEKVSLVHEEQEGAPPAAIHARLRARKG